MPREWRRPVLCLVTDRRRLAETLAQPEREAARLLASQIEGAILGGVDVVQVRERDLSARELSEVVRAAVTAAARSEVAVVVNDRIDVAIAAMSTGVHLREDSVGVNTARSLLRARQLLGRSVHDMDGVAAAHGADYLIAGTVFDSPSKQGGSTRLGLEGLRAVVERAGACPVWAIGGVTAERASVIAESGAAGVAAISMFIPAGCQADLVDTVQELTANLRFSFDSHWRRS